MTSTSVPFLAAALVAGGALACTSSRPGAPGDAASEPASSGVSSAALAPERLLFGALGEVDVFAPPQAPTRVVLLATGAAGLDGPARQLAARLAGDGALVAALSTERELAHLERRGLGCAYPAADLENLSNYVQMKRRLPEHHEPVLVGIDAGASLAWAAAAQAPAHLFPGLVTIGFCPELGLARPLCRGHALGRHGTGHGAGDTQTLVPAETFTPRWRAIQGAADSVCPPARVEPFVKAARDARLVTLDGLGHVPAGSRWISEVASSVAALAPRPAPAPPGAVSDLPLVEVPAVGKPRGELVLVISGDGGWADLDREVGGALARAGLPVVGLNALRYFWHARTAEGTAADVARVLRHYLAAWHEQRVVLVGYSRGADVLPAVWNRLPPDLRAATVLMVLLAPSKTVSYEFRLRDWLGGGAGPSQSTQPEIDRARSVPILCVYGREETDTACPTSKGANVTRVELPGGHHFDGDYLGIARRILAALPRVTSP